MSAPALTIGPNAEVSEAAARMVEDGVNRLPVVEATAELIGIVTRADLVRAFTRPDDAVAREIVHDVIERVFWLDPAEITVTVTHGAVRLTGKVETENDVKLLPELVAPRARGHLRRRGAERRSRSPSGRRDRPRPEAVSGQRHSGRGASRRAAGPAKRRAAFRASSSHAPGLHRSTRPATSRRRARRRARRKHRTSTSPTRRTICPTPKACSTVGTRHVMAERAQARLLVPEARLEARPHAPAPHASAARRAPPGDRPPRRPVRRTTWKCPCGCIGPPMTPNGPSRRPSSRSSPGMIVWYGRRPGASAFACPSHQREARGAVLERHPGPGHEHARAEGLVDRLDPRHGHPVGVHHGDVGRAAPRCVVGRRVDRDVGPHERHGVPPRRSSAKKSSRQRPVVHDRARVGERELHRLDLRVEARLEARRRARGRGAPPHPGRSGAARTR